MAEEVHLERTSGRATITLDRPERKNSLGPELVDTLARHLDTAIADDTVRVVVLTNTGNTFCAGADLKAVKPGPDDTAGPERRTFVDVFGLMLDSPKPVVGRIAGHCTGGGVGLAAACDISIVADDALIGFTEVRLGVAPAVISVVCLPKLRRADALEMFMTGQRHTAARAVEVGLLNRVVPRVELDAAVDELVGQLLLCGPNAIAAAKRMVFDVPGRERAEAFADMAELSRALFRSEEAVAGIAAFNARQPPPWAPSGSGG
jgi:methylglutaconyl-CoA hydratase